MWHQAQRFGLRALLISTACFALLGACTTQAPTSSAPQQPLIEQVIIQFKETPSDAVTAIAILSERSGLAMAFSRDMGSHFYLAKLKTGYTAAALQPYLDQIATMPNVASAEADLIMTTMPVK